MAIAVAVVAVAVVVVLVVVVVAVAVVVVVVVAVVVVAVEVAVADSSSSGSFVVVREGACRRILVTVRRSFQLETGIVSSSASPGRSKGARRHRRLARAMEAATFKTLPKFLQLRARNVGLFQARFSVWAEAASFAGGGLPRAPGTDPQGQRTGSSEPHQWWDHGHGPWDCEC